ncbi:hypothetical protein [Arsenicicoccus sp. oral taxon 190]|uniref:hypothetical protein n=1 Tax=Arsenicicoccus sp. oral taxon 190 TaxID=1658671 RepID=UPI00067A264B|nr:hypothetical protein [Arsenicicoccus sp. oral taxon 190]AKT51573.1 hypothetical protein ADJ73_10170 [Arsenicicoccus sp. oral taxon 190]
MRGAEVVWRLARLLAAGRRETDHLSGLLSVVAFAVATASLLVTAGGLQAFVERGQRAGAHQQDPGGTYVALALLATALLVVPILTLGGVAARLALARRDQRLAALRLAGATSGQVTALTLLEAATQATVGALIGVVGYLLALVPVGLLRFEGAPLGAGSLWLGLGTVAGVVLGIVALAVAAATSTLLRVVVTPLGVTARTTPRAQSVLRLVLGLGLGVAWVLGFKEIGEAGPAVGILMLVAVVAAVNVMGPWCVQLAARIAARLARRPTTLLAARRIQDDPKTTWRSVGALSLGVLVAALGGAMAAAMKAHPSPETPHLATDLVTGCAVALTILALVAATTSGVVHATAVYDQRETLRAQSLAGTTLGQLRAVRRREVTLPLGVGVTVATLQGLLLLVPVAASTLNAGAFGLLGASVVGSFVVALAAVRASDGLVRQAVDTR